MTGETTPYYLFHPCVPARVAGLYPEVRLVVLLREPAARAFSHYRHAVARGLEEEDFPTALAAERARIEAEEARLVRGELRHSPAHQRQSYRARGEYVTQLRRWLRHFPPERFLVLFAEDLWSSPRASLDVATDFLGLSPLPPEAAFPRLRVGEAALAPAETMEELRRHFAPLDRALAELLVERGVRLGPCEAAGWIRRELERTRVPGSPG